MTAEPFGRIPEFASRPIRRPDIDRLGPDGRLILVPGGEAVVVDARGGEACTIFDRDGGQPAIIVPFNAEKRVDLDALSFDDGLTSTRSNDILPRLNGTQRALLGSAVFGDPFDGLVSRADGPGSCVRFDVNRTCRLVITTPSTGSLVDATGHESDLEVLVSGQPRSQGWPLPDPLVPPRDEFVVDRRTARAYELPAGHFVQIIDIDGRQCSDFQAFPRRALDAGAEAFIDTTVSRSLAGAAYPMPGLFDKYYDQHITPLVQVVQDMCGRHDTFGLACAQRIYEAKGFLGHENCSDNISGEMETWGVGRREAWSAINFFFNTHVGQSNAILGDEGWSRPGDHVLLKALTDLVCVSTACPDDTSPINGWSPTDILVRIYDPAAFVKKQTGFRMTAGAALSTTGTTGFHDRTSKLTRQFRAVKDLWVPTAFDNEGAISEYWATREAATIQDLSQISKFDVTGPDAECLLDHALPRDMRKLSIGQIVYSPMLRPHGGIFDDGTLFRLSDKAFRWMCGSAVAGDWLRSLARDAGMDVHIRNASRQIHNLAVQGPKSRDVLKKMIWAADHQPGLADLKRFRFLIGRLHGFDGPPVLVSRTGYTGERGYEVFCKAEDGPAVWDAIWDAGEPLGLKPMGLDGLEFLRIEAGLPVSGQEFTEDTDPFEAGLGFAVPLARTDRDFVGRAAIEARRDDPVHRLIGIDVDGAYAVSHGDPVFVSDQVRAGVVTSACLSPRLGHTIAMARVRTAALPESGVVEIGRLDGDAKRLRGSIRPLPFHRSPDW